MRMMNVNLLVSEYEWTCPICNRLNKEIEVTEVVVCGNCKTALAVNP